jgi:hypothetical protein
MHGLIGIARPAVSAKELLAVGLNKLDAASCFLANVSSLAVNQ